MDGDGFNNESDASDSENSGMVLTLIPISTAKLYLPALRRETKVTQLLNLPADV
jgi:hypothetical protein